jgi:hypothetical protein
MCCAVLFGNLLATTIRSLIFFVLLACERRRRPFHAPPALGFDDM